MNIDITKCRKALQLLIEGKHSLHIPSEKDDADVLIADALKVLERLQEEEDLRTEPLPEIVQSWVDACAEKDILIEALEKKNDSILKALSLSISQETANQLILDRNVAEKEVNLLKTICFTALQEIFNSEYSVSTKSDLVNIARTALLRIET